MKLAFRALLFIMVEQVFVLPLYCQEIKSLSPPSRIITLGDFSKAAGVKFSYSFYYQPDHRDSVIRRISFVDISIDTVLERSLKATPYYYLIDHQAHNVFITYKQAILVPHPDWMQQRTVIARSGLVAAAASDYVSVEKRQVKSTIENKLLEIGSRSVSNDRESVTISGYIRSISNGKPVQGISVRVGTGKSGTITDHNGFYSLKLSKGKQILMVSGIGIKSTKRQLMVFGSGRLNIEIFDDVQNLRAVVINSERTANVKDVNMGVEKLTLQNIKQVPVVFGETDVLKVVLTLPGVKSVGEASTGINVRGGAVDQNLILYNDATIYNPSHFFGFFSAFNADGVKDVELFKNSIPAYYGGRISSVLSVNSRESNNEKYTGTVGIGLLTSRFNVEGPILKNRTSFMAGGRLTYSNWILKALPGNAQFKDARVSFSDFDLHIDHKFNKKNSLHFTGYYSYDNSDLNTDTTFGYSNRNISLKWKHIFNEKLSLVFTGGYDGYGYKNYTDSAGAESYELNFNINQSSVKTDIIYYTSSRNVLRVGGSGILYQLNPGTLVPRGRESLVAVRDIEDEHGLESAFYIDDTFDLNANFVLSGGIRYSLYSSLGPKMVNYYAPGQRKDESSIVQKITYKSGESIKTYQGPEYRISARWAFPGDFSIKAGFNSSRQYIHMLSNTTAVAPTDIWKLSDNNIRPQKGDQLAIGFYKNFKSNTIETSAEFYYKRSSNLLDYKSGAQLILNASIEQDVIETKGKAYGAEFMIRKTEGKINGWASYTYSRSLLKSANAVGDESVNNGNFYRTNYDKPHELSIVGNYRFSHRYSLSLNSTYSTGRPITLPIGKYLYAGSQRVLYSDRNEYRIPDYFRIDIGLNIEGNHKVHQRLHNSWTVGIYNLTGRNNAYSTYFNSEGGAIRGYKLSIFNSPVPFINYNIRF